MPLLTLTSDIGNQDYLVGAIKAQLLQINPDFRIVDITHNIAPFNSPHAAYVCSNALKNFPDFTYHIILVNLFEKKPDQLLLAFHKNQYLLCADNGLITMILEENPEMIIGLPVNKKTERNTINCAITMGKAIQQITEGKPLQSIGNPDVHFEQKKPLRPAQGENWIEGQIIFIDNFENVIVNITRELFEEQRKGRNYKIAFKANDYIDRISESYADVPEGTKLALFNSAGYLEIALNKGNAAGLFGLKSYSNKHSSTPGMLQSQVTYQTVRVYFE
jgi:S-adenosylmethionine hydrolase